MARMVVIVKFKFTKVNAMILWQMWSQVTSQLRCICRTAAVAQQFWCHSWGCLGHICIKMFFILSPEIILSEGCSHVFSCLHFVLNTVFYDYIGTESWLQSSTEAGNLFSLMKDFIVIPICDVSPLAPIAVLCPTNQKPWSFWL